MTTFTTITFYRETETGAWQERTFILRSNGSLHGKMGKGTRAGQIFNAMHANEWRILDISEYPNRDTFEIFHGF